MRFGFVSSFEKTAMGIATVDTAEYRVLDSNTAFQRMLGYSKEELTGKVFADFTFSDDLNIERPLLQELLEGKKRLYN